MSYIGHVDRDLHYPKKMVAPVLETNGILKRCCKFHKTTRPCQ